MEATQCVDRPTREVKTRLHEELGLKTPRQEKLVLDECILERIDRVRKFYGNLSSYEMFDILLEEKLKSPEKPLRPGNTAPKHSRYIPVAVKYAVHGGQCVSCGVFPISYCRRQRSLLVWGL